MEQIISVLLRATGASAFGAQMSQIAGSAGVAQRAIQGAQSVIGGLKYAIAGAIGGVTIASVARLGGEFENTQNKMAGFLNALGQAPNFNAALSLSADLMKQIELSSAALPGEAEDYVKVFTTALPEVQRAVGGTLTEMVKFTNQMAAIGATMGIDPSQVARDVQLMLRAGQGGAGMDVRTFTSMLPFLKQVEGQANLTRESFNKLNEQGRARLLQKSMSLLAPMIEHASKSWDAVKGTTTSILKTMFRMSSAGLFDNLKTSLARVNKLLMDDQGNLTAFANRIVDYGKRVGSVLAKVVDKGVTLLESLFGHADKIPAVFAQIESAVKGVGVALALFKIGGVASTIAGVLSGGGALGAAAAATSFAVATAGLAAVGVAAVVAGTAAYALAMDWEQFAPQLDEITTQFKTQVMPALASAGTSMMQLLDPFLKAVGKQSVKVLSTSVELLGFAAYSAADAVDSLAYLMNNMVKSSDLATQLAEAGKRQRDLEKTNYRYDMTKHLVQPFRMGADFDPTFKPKAAPTTTPPGRGGAKVHQDFRGSKFTIAQKFEEGYDPDRVAVAFANDLRKIGEFRLQSGLEPMFGVGG